MTDRERADKAQEALASRYDEAIDILHDAWPSMINAGIDHARGGRVDWAKYLTELLGIDVRPRTSNVGKRRAFAVFNRDGFKCYYCGRTPKTENIVLHADHVHPRSLGGTDTADNIVTACSVCNASKSDTVLDNEAEILEDIAQRNEVAGLSNDTIIKDVRSYGEKTNQKERAG